MKKSRIITLQQLKDARAPRACTNQVQLFKKHFGQQVEVTIESATVVSSHFNFDFAAAHFLSPQAQAAYKKIQVPALEKYTNIEASAWQEYEKIKAGAREKHKNIEAPVRTENKKARVRALAKQREIRAATLVEQKQVHVRAKAEYETARAAAWKEYEKVRASAWAKAYINDSQKEKKNHDKI